MTVVLRAVVAVGGVLQQHDNPDNSGIVARLMAYHEARMCIVSLLQINFSVFQGLSMHKIRQLTLQWLMPD